MFIAYLISISLPLTIFGQLHDGYIHYDVTGAFYKYHSTKMTFIEALAACESENTHLATPTSIDEVNYLSNTSHWIGLNDILQEGSIVTADGISTSDIFTNWGPRQPDGGIDENCILIKTGGIYHDWPCHHKFNFYCKLSSNTYELENECIYKHTEFIYIKDLNAHYKRHNKAMTFDEASKLCSTEGSQLLIPETEKEVKHTTNLGGDVRTWIGIHDNAVEGRFNTIDGRNISDVYIKWNSGEPNDRNSTENCLVLHKNRTSNDLSCDTLNKFICKISGDKMQSSIHCNYYNTGYIYNVELKRCYKFYKTIKTWIEAYGICKDENSTLVILNSQTEADAITNYISENTPPNVNVIHSGFLPEHAIERFRTVEGFWLENAGYEHWASEAKDVRCGSIKRDGSLKLISCKIKRMFICEKKSE